MKRTSKLPRKLKLPAPAAPPKKSRSADGAPFPVVGIGASAGGLEALEVFLKHVAANPGMAFVIVQHLDPTHKGIMPELLQRATRMKVMQVKDRTRVRPNCVYVIPPNRDMSLLHGILHLLEPVAPRGLRLPIDFFFRSLALDQEERSIGVILSGMGSDGTLGLRAIKEKAGVVLVQDPTSAKFDSMPRSAIDAGLADIVAPVEELPGRILAYQRRTPLITPAQAPLETETQSALEKAIILLRAQTGHDFSLYKRNTLYRRIERRMGIHLIGKIGGYVRYLQENSQELDLLFKELLIGVTGFFRDPDAWEQLSKQVVPGFFKHRPPNQPIRIWVTGCSTGEEAYSLAMLFREAQERIKPKGSVELQIFATDLDRDAIEKARQGVYPENIAADVSPARLSRFFVQEESGYRVRKEIRETVIFAPQNLIMDPPFTKLDVLSCRNLLIYLAPEMQKKLMPLFHYSLSAGGILFLGSAETVGTFGELFTPVHAKSRIYRRRESALPAEPIEFPSAFREPPAGGSDLRPPAKPPASLQFLADQLVLQRFALPAVLFNDKGDILYISGHTGKYLEPAAGKANWNVFAMARDGLRAELSSAFPKALRQKDSVNLRGLAIRTSGADLFVDVSIQRLKEPGPLEGLFMMVFTERPAPVVAKALTRATKATPQTPQMAEMERKLQQYRDEMRHAREEMQTSQEELKSTNEELQSTNEELQSTNEELTTSKEEMQSLNEELQTVNAELQAKVDDLSLASSDMKNLLNSTDIATVFLDSELRVRRFTTQATKIIKLISVDLGRPITDLATDLRYPALEEDAREVLHKLVSLERTIGSKDGRWFAVRIMPYRTQDNRIDGVVLTFADITRAKILETKLRGKQATLKKHAAGQSLKLEQAIQHARRVVRLPGKGRTGDLPTEV
jgi:chemotaxis methyl-accepting protein methylase